MTVVQFEPWPDGIPNAPSPDEIEAALFGHESLTCVSPVTMGQAVIKAAECEAQRPARHLEEPCAVVAAGHVLVTSRLALRRLADPSYSATV